MHMITRHTRGKVTWIDLECPTLEELDSVLTEFNIDARIHEEIISPTPYPLVIDFPKYVYLILHFPTADPSGGARNQEIDFIVGKNFLITARYEIVDSIHNMHKVFEAEELLGLPNPVKTAEQLLERIMRRLYGAIREEAENVSRLLEKIEHDIFSETNKNTVKGISRAGRILLRFETALKRHEEALSSFLTLICTTRFFGKKFQAHAEHIRAERAHVAALVSSYRSAATELRDTNDSLLSASQNEVMQKLTILAFAAFPLTVIAGVFGMNTKHMPIIDSPYAFWIIILLMVASAAGILAYFRFKRWI